ncbi:TlpA disulfide reductase family protein [Massilia sp. S19_KUP03_FR1]|uniref:TlpA disulfide reductase family protein n=1 Tax=Massilia sp. S19_KUP03_FR1 TaxID=3025503 RepID=UPI002FCD7E6B
MPLSLRGLFAALLLISLTAHAAPAEGDVPPKYVGKLIDGTAAKVSDYAGKAVVLSFWATWCTYCLKELPVLNAIQNSGAKDRIEVIALNIEERDVFRGATRALSKVINIRMAYDPDHIAQSAYGVKGIPHMVIIGKDGKIIRVYRGYAESSLGQIVADINQATGASAP